jgi:hypothetical protein
MPVPHFTRSRRGVTVYFIQAGGAGPIKIGATSKDSPRHRLGDLQTAHYEELRLLGSITTQTSIEFALHDHFKHLRIRGEWFRPDPELMEFIIREAIDFGPDETIEKVPAAFARDPYFQPTDTEDSALHDLSPDMTTYFADARTKGEPRKRKAKKKSRQPRAKNIMVPKSSFDPDNYCPICGKRLTDDHRCDPQALRKIDEDRGE